MNKHLVLAVVAGVLLAVPPVAPPADAATGGICPWSYKSPKEWGDICSPKYFLCAGTGRSQSPIDIPALPPDPGLPRIELFYGPPPLLYEVENTEHVLRVLTKSQTNVLRVGGQGSEELYRLSE